MFWQLIRNVLDLTKYVHFNIQVPNNGSIYVRQGLNPRHKT